MAKLLDLADYVQRQGELGRQRGQESRLGQLASQAYTTQTADRPQLLGQMAAVSPDAAATQQKMFRQDDSQRVSELSRKARLFVGMAESGNQAAVAGLYPQIAQEARSLGMGDIPLQYDASFLPGLKQFAAILDDNPQTQQGMAPRVVGDALVDHTGKVLYQSPQQQEYQWSDSRGVWIPKPGAPRSNEASYANEGLPLDSPIAGGGDPQSLYASLGDKHGFTTTSTTRTPQQNASVNGVPNSQHIAGTARDFSVRGKTPQQVQAFISDLRSQGFEAFVHDAGSGPHVHAELPPGQQQRQGNLSAVAVDGIGPKTEAGYTTLTPQQAQEIGLPPGTVAQRSPQGQIQIINKPRDLPTGGQVIDNGDGTTTYIPAGKITEGERNAAGFYQRMEAATKELDDLVAGGYDPTNPRDRGAANTPFVGNSLMTPTGQQYRQAAMNWIRANLRKESGAAIGVKEAEDEYDNYFPVFGDSPQVIEQKRRNRQTTERAMRQAAGGGLAPATAKQAGGATDGWSIQRVD